MIRLDADAQHPALAHRVAAPGHHADLARGQHEILVAQQLGHRRGDLGRQPGPDRDQVRLGRGVVEDPFAERAHGQATERAERIRVERLADQAADLVVLGIDQRVVDDLPEGQLGQDELGGDPLALGVRRQPGKLIA